MGETTILDQQPRAEDQVEITFEARAVEIAFETKNGMALRGPLRGALTVFPVGQVQVASPLAQSAHHSIQWKTTKQETKGAN